MRFLRHILILLAFIPAFMPAMAIEARLQASLITCWPGPIEYELCGHEAIRISGLMENGAPIDSVWNYGVFDFATPNFIYRFVKGETDYMVESYPFSWFLPLYVSRGSKVVEQQLNLTPEETSRLLKLLQVNALPQNRTYRYNYVRDNCSTRVAAMIDSAAAPRRIIYPDSVSFKSFRSAMRYYHRNYPWYQFGIDLALGSGIDSPLTSREEIFAPLLFEQKAEKARFKDGAPLVREQITLFEGRDAVLGPTPWWRTPMAVSLLIMAISLCVAAGEYVKKRVAKFWMCAFFLLLGIGGCIIWFLVFVSSHDSTSPNLLSIWLNPLQLLAGLLILWRHTRPVAKVLAYANVIIILLMAAIWPFQQQVANPAIFPLWVATLALSLTYAIIQPSSSYNNKSRRKNKDNSANGAGRRGSNDSVKVRKRNNRR